VTVDAEFLNQVGDATWPPAEFRSVGPWTLRRGLGGGKRVSSATTDRAVTEAEIDQAIAGMAAMDQPPLFMLRPGQEALDEQLAERGFQVIDPVVIYTIPVADLCDIPIPRVTVISIWEPLAIMREIWAAGGIGPARLAVMDRVTGSKIALLGRFEEKPSGVAFVAIHEGAAMLHALEVVPHQRRKGVGVWFMRAAAIWARDNGAQTLSLMCTRANTGANALYTSLGMQPVGEYHYRHLPT